ncbi:MAG TPA: type IV secretion system DNA-binding domain-containing protein, partial [Solirubrobacteraceae bacterium]|nr:type IV secretion system DNA-binding domain-containing protein [Solirubrobacteraceae bacterium]
AGNLVAGSHPARSLHGGEPGGCSGHQRAARGTGAAEPGLGEIELSARPWHRYWVLPAFVGLLLAPAPWGAVVAIAAAVGATGWRLARAARARRARSPAEGDGAFKLGSDQRGRAVLLTDHELSAHGLILGASGAGKSTTLLRMLTEQIARGRPVVAIDMKGSPAFARVLGEAARAAGRPFAVWSIDGPAHWNPLRHGNATELKDKLMATERFTEPHYQRAAERYIQIVLQVLAAASPGRAPTLGEVVHLMDPARLPSMLRGVDHELRDRIRDYLAGLTPDQLSAARGLQTRLAVLTESHTAPYLAPGAGPMIDLHQALRGPQVVLFSLNSARYGRLAAQLGTLAVQDLVSASGDRLDDARPGVPAAAATIAIDEFSALGADHVVALLSRGRESGLSVLVATQEMADLDRAAAGLRDQVVGVTALKVFHRQEVPQSARTIALMIGTEQVWEETRQTAGRLLGGYDAGRGTRRQVERFIVHPNEIQSLRTGEAIVISNLSEQRVQRVRVEPPRAVSPARSPDPPRPAEPGRLEPDPPIRRVRGTQRSRPAGSPPPSQQRPPGSLGR